ncbi:MAG: four helix bundle protein [Bacteroidales bacterium]|nr:four helix bundle protein [Candidatus Colicola equi]
MHNFHNLQIWTDAIALTDMIYHITQSFPAEERFGLISQMQRAAVSIPSNIAEGSGRDSNKDFIHFLNISLGSSYELETQVIIAERRAYITAEQAQSICTCIASLQKRIQTFKQHINQ